MSGIRHFIIALVVALLVGPVAAQGDGRINPQVIDIAIYCADGGIVIYNIDREGAGSQALFATREQIAQGFSNAKASGQAVTVATGSFDTALIALPSLQLRASQRLDDRPPYDYDFNGDTCASLENLPPPSSAPIQNAAAPADDAATTAETVTTDAAATTADTAPAATTDVTYTIQPGDTLNKIAQEYGVSVADLIAANNFANPNAIFPGTQIVIPNQAPPEPTAVPEAPAETAPQPQIVQGGGNLLRDGSFEGVFTGRGSYDFNIPGEWDIQVIRGGAEWQNLTPTAFPHRAWVIRDGAQSLNMNKGFATYTVYLLQRVAVPEGASLNGTVWGWYHTCDAGSQNCSNSSNPVIRVGIAPDGGTDPNAANVVWGGNLSPQGSWGLAGATATAEGGVVTMFIYAAQDTPRTINELYLDEASLVASS